MRTIREFTDPAHAGVAQSFLRDNEINAVLLDEGASAWTANRVLVPVRLAVPAAQAEAALALLDQFEVGGDLPDSQGEASVESSSGQREPNNPAVRDNRVDTARLFRSLVLISTLSYSLGFFEFVLAGERVPQSTLDAMSWRGIGALLSTPPALSWLFLLLYLVAAVGLWRFSRAARILFSTLSALSLLIYLLSGIQVQTALGTFLWSLTAMADGAILAMAYTSPIKRRFR